MIHSRLVHTMVVAALLIPLSNIREFGKSAAAEVQPKTAADAPVPDESVKNANEFACDLYRLASSRAGNLFFSPASIGSVLEILEVGSAGQTNEEIRKVLRISGDKPRGNHSLNQSGDGFLLKSANRIWGRKGLKIKESFQTAVQRQFGAEVVYLDFAAKGSALEKINDWGEEATNGKIPQLLSSPPTPDVQLLVTNATYFKGRWLHRFDAKYTENKVFYSSGKERIEVPTMVQTDEFLFWETAELKALELPYEGDTMSAVFILPVERDGLASIEKQLTSATLQKWFEKLDGARNPETKKPPKVSVRIPKFRFDLDLPLNNLLGQMGLKTVFSDLADFSGIGDVSQLSTITHKALIQVDETGTVAAATSVAIVGASRPAMFFADHPFIFMIRDRKNGAILFIGRVESPEKLSDAKAS